MNVTTLKYLALGFIKINKIKKIKNYYIQRI